MQLQVRDILKLAKRKDIRLTHRPKPVLRNKLEPRTGGFCFLYLTSLLFCLSASFASESTNQHMSLFLPLGGKLGPI